MKKRIIAGRNMTEAEEFIERLCREYIEKHIKQQECDDLIAENNREKEHIKGYHGREILELLQNADDAYQQSIIEGNKPDEDLEVVIEYKNDILRVINTGTFFSKSGIKAIVQGNNSTKDVDYIGNKGTGFRSVLNWATKVRILSGDFYVEFSKEIAQKVFDKIKDEKQIVKQLKRKKDLYIPMLAVPENLTTYERNNKTTIEVHIDSNKIQDDYSVEKQLNGIDVRILLFLPNIRRIRIVTNEPEVVYQKEINGDNISLITKVDGCRVSYEEFIQVDKTLKDFLMEGTDKKSVGFSIAVPTDFTEFKSEYMYAYFPLLDTPSPFNCVMHGTYILGANRNTIDKSAENKKILKEQLKFLIEVAQRFIDKKDYDTVYNILMPLNRDGLLSKFSIYNEYLDDLCTLKMFPSVNDETLSVLDDILRISNDFPDLFVGEHFSKLLKPINNKNGINLLNQIIPLKEIEYSDEALLSDINAVSDNWTISEQIEVFVWWNNKWTSNRLNTNPKILPHLIKKQDNTWLKTDEDCYFMAGNAVNIALPEWVKVPSIDAAYQKELFVATEKLPQVIETRKRNSDDTSRIISQTNIFPCVQFHYSDLSTIVGRVNSSVSNYEQGVDFVKWLWKNYGHNEQWQPAGLNDTFKNGYNFPSLSKTNNQCVEASKRIYFGQAYGNNLGEKLFGYNNFSAFPPIGVFDVNTDDIHQFKLFIKKFGVCEYPTIEKQTISGDDMYQPYILLYKPTIYDTPEMSTSITVTIQGEVLAISNLREILQNLSTEDILTWILNDIKLKNHLTNPNEPIGSVISYSGSRRTGRYEYQESIKNYILEIFNCEKWIRIGNNQYSPREILSYSLSNIKFTDFVPVLAYSSNKNISDTNNIFVVKDCFIDVLKCFDFKNQITDLPSEKFYEILLKLPNMEMNRGIELFKAIYNIVQQPDFKRNYPASHHKTIYFKEGKMLVKYGGIPQYYNVQKSILPSNQIINKNKFPIVAKGERTNNDNFVRVFNCKKYERDYSIVLEDIEYSPANVKFQQYFNDFKKYAAAYGKRNANIDEFGKKLNITLAQKIPVMEGDTINYVEDEYAYIGDSSTNWYIKVTGDNFNVMKLSNIIKDIYEHIAYTPGFDGAKLRELFNADSKSSRELLIEDEFGTLDVIMEQSYGDTIKRHFLGTVLKIDSAYDIDKTDIDFDNFSEINFENAEKIITLFKALDTDIDAFYKNGFEYQINLVPYFHKKGKELIKDKREEYKNVLYSRALNDMELQASFIADVSNFEDFGLSEVPNSVYYDVEKMIYQTFGHWTSDEIIKYADAEYASNYDKMNPDNLYIDEIAGSKEAQRMIYFDRVEEFNGWVEKVQNQTLIEKDINDQNAAMPIVILQKNPIPFSNKSDNRTAKAGNSHTAITQSALLKHNKNKKIKGNKGEKLIYDYLCKQYGQTNVFPRSEAFVDLKIIKAGQAVSGQYDLSYRDESGKIYYVEVKTGNNNTFYISPGELAFAKEHSRLGDYKLYYVYDTDTENPKFCEIDNDFWMNEKYLCGPESFIIQF